MKEKTVKFVIWVYAEQGPGFTTGTLYHMVLHSQQYFLPPLGSLVKVYNDSPPDLTKNFFKVVRHLFYSNNSIPDVILSSISEGRVEKLKSLGWVRE